MEHQHVVELYYDIVSPYSYIAFEILTKCRSKWKNMDLRLMPTRVKEVMRATENPSPGFVPAKREYMRNDFVKVASYYQIPFIMPADIGTTIYVKGSEKALRLLHAAKLRCPEYLEKITRELYRRVWVKGEGIVDDESLKQACYETELTHDITVEIIEMAKQDLTSVELRTCVNKAVENGAFGAPTMVLYKNDEKEVFFGCDRIFLLAHSLGQEWPAF